MNVLCGNPRNEAEVWFKAAWPRRCPLVTLLGLTICSAGTQMPRSKRLSLSPPCGLSPIKSVETRNHLRHRTCTKSRL